jgi:MarR family transcriptional regulator, 2-MHQ and catechol-resistance regulon repressor
MGTRYRGTAEEVRALSAFITLVRAAETVSSFANAHLKERGLSESQFGTLEALYHCGELRQGDLAGKLLRSFGSITSVVDGLERRRLVARERPDRDRRVVNVRLTAAGRRVVEAALPAHVRRIVGRFKTLSPREQRTLRALCRTLGRGREEETS